MLPLDPAAAALELVAERLGARRKEGVVLRLLRGESLDLLALETGEPAGRIAGWREAGQRFATRARARTAIFDIVRTFYNPLPAHSSLGTSHPPSSSDEQPNMPSRQSRLTPWATAARLADPRAYLHSQVNPCPRERGTSKNPARGGDPPSDSHG